MGPDASAAVDRLVELCKEQSDYNTFDGRHATDRNGQKRTGPVYCFLGLLGFRKVDSNPSLLAVFEIQSGLP